MWNREYQLKRTVIGRLPYDGDLLEEMNRVCTDNDIRIGGISLIGALKNIKLGFYDQDKKEYVYLPEEDFGQDLEIASCTGNVSIKDDKPFAHLHIVVSDRKGRCFGGHLMPGSKIFACEFMIYEFEGEELVRGLDEETRLPLWKM